MQCMQQLLKGMQQHIYEEMPLDVAANIRSEQMQKILNTLDLNIVVFQISLLTFTLY